MSPVARCRYDGAENPICLLGPDGRGPCRFRTAHLLSQPASISECGAASAVALQSSAMVCMPPGASEMGDAEDSEASCDPRRNKSELSALSSLGGWSPSRRAIPTFSSMIWMVYGECLLNRYCGADRPPLWIAGLPTQDSRRWLRAWSPTDSYQRRRQLLHHVLWDTTRRQ